MEDVIKQLKELGELLKSGAISQEEFQVLKKELIGSNKVADYSTSYSDTSQSKEYKEKNVQPEYKELPNNESSILKNNIFQTTDQFWETFYASLESPISYWRDYKSCTVSEWIDNCSNNQFSAHLDIIFNNAPLLKNEYPAVWSNGTGMILTNYRLFVNLDTGLFIIPLCRLTSYKMVGVEKVRIVYNVNSESQHIDVYAWLLPEYIDSAKNAKQWIILGDKELEYLQYSFYDLKSRFNLNPPKISYDYSRYDGNTKNKSNKKEYINLYNIETGNIFQQVNAWRKKNPGALLLSIMGYLGYWALVGHCCCLNQLEGYRIKEQGLNYFLNFQDNYVYIIMVILPFLVATVLFVQQLINMVLYKRNTQSINPYGFIPLLSLFMYVFLGGMLVKQWGFFIF